MSFQIPSDILGLFVLIAFAGAGYLVIFLKFYAQGKGKQRY